MIDVNEQRANTHSSYDFEGYIGAIMMILNGCALKSEVNSKEVTPPGVREWHI